MPFLITFRKQPMNPAFAVVSLGYIRREWELPKENPQLRFTVNHVAADVEAKAWITNAAMSAGVRGLYTETENILRGLPFDRSIPSPERSHQGLRDQASDELARKRPALITEEV